LVATGDDAMKQANPKTAAALMKVSHDAGFDAVLVSSMWTPGATAPSSQDRHSLRNVVKAADDLHMRVFVFVWHGLSGSAPPVRGIRRRPRESLPAGPRHRHRQRAEPEHLLDAAVRRRREGRRRRRI